MRRGQVAKSYIYFNYSNFFPELNRHSPYSSPLQPRWRRNGTAGDNPRRILPPGPPRSAKSTVSPDEAKIFLRSTDHQTHFSPGSARAGFGAVQYRAIPISVWSGMTVQGQTCAFPAENILVSPAPKWSFPWGRTPRRRRLVPNAHDSFRSGRWPGVSLHRHKR